MTLEELTYRQNWTLNQKIDHSVGTIESFLSRTKKIPYVSFSGGKDSTVLLDLVRRFIDSNTKAVFCNTGNEFPEIVRFVRQTENVKVITPEITVKEVLSKYGFPLISKEQAFYIRQVRSSKSQILINKRLYGKKVKGSFCGKISNRWQFLIKAPFQVSEQCCEFLKKRPFKKYEKETGEVPILGIMACESDLRKHEYIKRGSCNSFEGKRIASYPMSIWTDKDIWDYSRLFNIPLCSIYKIPGVSQTGCMFCGFGCHRRGDNRFNLLFKLYPKAFRIFMNYTNNGYKYRQALHAIGMLLPDEELFVNN